MFLNLSIKICDHRDFEELNKDPFFIKNVWDITSLKSSVNLKFQINEKIHSQKK